MYPELCLKLPVSQKEKDTSGTSVLAIRLKLCEHMLERGSSVKEPTTKKTSCTAQGDRHDNPETLSTSRDGQAKLMWSTSREVQEMT
ncbi:hypothetical protein P5673_020702 [Acropora cervicornis]|uniref:Uncharacterized protein n=1 Tax=Acropora cervicornis TaxID=6130 RepID=A0AAD9Q9K6_ACRCE|nr:hypothetical protein P5673_020702 [Acropora cervicornis]